MASTQEVIDVFSTELGIKSAVLGRYARSLKEAVGPNGERRDLWPVGGFGGGRKSAQPNGYHDTNLFFALYAPQPADAVAVVDELWTWKKGPNMSASGKQLPDRDRGYSNLGEFVRLPIEALARADNATRSQWAINMAAIRLCVDLEDGIAFVMNSATRQFQEDCEIFHAPWRNPFENESPNRVKRIVEVPLALVVVAADLLADTLAQRGGLDLPPSGEAQTATSPENETAPTLPGVEADTRTKQRHDKGHRRGLNSPEGKAEIYKSQVSSCARPSPLSLRSSPQHEFAPGF